jgi:hypothetical protein
MLGDKPPKNAAPGPKRRSTQLDFGNLAPLKPGGTVGFSTFRDNEPEARLNKTRKKSNGDTEAMQEDSDEDNDDADIVGKMEDVDDDDKDVKTRLSPEDAKFQGELADGVGRIKVSHFLCYLSDLSLTFKSAQASTFCRASQCQLSQITRFHQ